MTRVRAICLFGVILIVALIVLCPLGAGIALSGLDKTGLTARGASGTIWSGSLTDASFGPVSLGDLKTGLRPLALLAGRAEFGMSGNAGEGRLIAAHGLTGIAQVAAKLNVAQAFAPLSLDSFSLNEVTVTFSGDRCVSADGRVRATFSGELGRTELAVLTGTARCDAGELILPLVSQSALQRLTLRISGQGQWRAVLAVRTTDPATIAKLASNGFAPLAGGYVLHLSGRL
jgi:general secretion pathway protein N